MDKTTDEERRHANVINISEAAAMDNTKGQRFGATIKQLGTATGGQRVGCNYFEVAPGRTAFPRHWHGGVEEVIFVIEGDGTLRIGDKNVEVGAGDYITLPLGPEHAHQLENSGAQPLRYLCLSSMASADVIGYPDSKKFAAMASPSPDFFAPPWVRVLFRDDQGLGYYDGEETE